MISKLSAVALAVALASAGAAYAQEPLAGGPTAKGNAPFKSVHTVNDGAAKPGANSFTQKQARQHIINAGYQAVSGLTKGKDGVWRGTATRGGIAMEVAMDFKGNVTDGGPVNTTVGDAVVSAQSTASNSGPSANASPARTPPRRKHSAAGCSTHPGPNGVACSGVDTNHNGVSDKEDRALHRQHRCVCDWLQPEPIEHTSGPAFNQVPWHEHHVAKMGVLGVGGGIRVRLSAD